MGKNNSGSSLEDSNVLRKFHVSSSNSSYAIAELLRKLRSPATGNSLLPEINVEDNLARQSLASETTEILEWLSQENPTVTVIKILVRPISYDGRSLSGSSGICHAFILAQYDHETYLFERLQQGIRVRLLNGKELNAEQRNSIFIGTYQVNLLGRDLVNFVDKKRKLPYSLFSNNCIHFAFQFGKQFLGRATSVLGFSGFNKCAEFWRHISCEAAINEVTKKINNMRNRALSELSATTVLLSAFAFNFGEVITDFFVMWD